LGRNAGGSVGRDCGGVDCVYIFQVNQMYQNHTANPSCYFVHLCLCGSTI
jgi:hypothetical protein